MNLEYFDSGFLTPEVNLVLFVLSIVTGIVGFGVLI